jgi:predicted DNA-binding transcriptional regulator AlpA
MSTEAHPPSSNATHAIQKSGAGLAPLLLRAPEAAAYCAVSEATWWRWDAAGKIPRRRKVSSGVRVWNRPELERWAALGFPARQNLRRWNAPGVNLAPALAATNSFRRAVVASSHTIPANRPCGWRLGPLVRGFSSRRPAESSGK